MDRSAELVGDDQVQVLIGIGGEVPLCHLNVAVLTERLDSLGVERDRAP